MFARAVTESAKANAVSKAPDRQGRARRVDRERQSEKLAAEFERTRASASPHWSFSKIPVFPSGQPSPPPTSESTQQCCSGAACECSKFGARGHAKAMAGGASRTGASSRGHEAHETTAGPDYAGIGARSLHDFGSISAERKDGVVHGPPGGANRFADCPAQWKPAANAAQKLGSSWLDNVVNGLTTLPKPIPGPVANLLTKHFHTTLDKDLAKITGRFKQLNAAINKSIDFQCETSCDPDVVAYVYSIWSDLHLCPYWFHSGAELQASSVIHELAHDVVGCDDNAYEWETAKYRNMSVSDAIDNANSYAHFAWDASKP